MKKMKLGLSAAALMCAFSMSANASVCTWEIESTSVSYTSKTITSNFVCLEDTSVRANKSWVTSGSGNPTCAISVSTGYVNSGNCTTPNIVAAPPTYTTGQKVCEFNDPITGTTPGCTLQAVGATGNHQYYVVKKDGYDLLSITKTWVSGNCTLSGSNTNFYVGSSSCTNYSIYAY